MTRKLGPYEIRGELGRGAMAVVWRAYDPVLDREVALKEAVVPHGTDALAATELAARFVREARAAGRLSHPGIVTVYSAEIYGGRPAIAMELIRGETLTQVLRRGALVPLTALALFNQLLDAVGYAHANGVVHRDIKPDNIFVTTEGRVKLADFGVAHLSAGTALTQAGTVIGTPGYMAPEQIVGDTVDERADIFALGAVLHEMLTGKNPFGAGPDVPITTVLYRVVHAEPPALPEALLVGLPGDIRATVGAALEKSPEERFPNVEAFRRALKGGPIEVVTTLGSSRRDAASAPTVIATTPRLGHSRWLPYVAVAAVGVFAVGALVLWATSGGFSSGGSGSVTTVGTAAIRSQAIASPSDAASTSTASSAFAAVLSTTSRSGITTTTQFATTTTREATTTTHSTTTTSTETTTTTPSGSHFAFTVDATNPQGTFVAHVNQGSRVTFTTSGQWQMGGGKFVGADGDNYPSAGEQDAIVPSARFGVLLGAIHGDGGSTIYVVFGSSGSVELPVAGDLYLVFNDRPQYYGDNSGSMRVLGTIVPPK